jgi:hypothetical protein
MPDDKRGKPSEGEERIVDAGYDGGGIGGGHAPGGMLDDHGRPINPGAVDGAKPPKDLPRDHDGSEI